MSPNQTTAVKPAPSQEILHRDAANAIRALAMDAVQKANSGHPGMPMGMADVATVLFDRFLKFDAADPDWPDRDRFVLSAGHGSMLLYALLYLTGVPGMTRDQLEQFRQLGSMTAGHPEFSHAPGVETTTGPLGQGLANAVGMAMAERLLAQRFGAELVDHYTYVIAGDGCLMEGISHEAISLAGHLRLNKLIVLFDDNAISIDGPTALTVSDDQAARFAASGWDVTRADGHDPDAIDAAISAARASDRPSLICCRTVIGYGAPSKEGTAATHGAPLGADEVAGARERLGWPHAPFEVPEEILDWWRAIGGRGAAERQAWTARLAGHPKLEAFNQALAGEIPEAAVQALTAHKAKLAVDRPKLATRQSSKAALEAIAPNLPWLIGGSADLTGSNGTKTSDMAVVAADDFSGTYIHYGVREHAMAAAMNGLALHGGLIPYGGTFLVFTDYARPAIRLSALMGLRVIYVMTHDSIGLGEDGPTHQPIEHLAALRAMPNLCVFRPADAIETAECWELALAQDGRPSVLALTRQGVPTLRQEADENRCARGGYVLAEADGTRQVSLLATGSEVEIAMAARDRLAAEGIGAAVISLPCWELFEEQDAAYRVDVLGSAPRIAVEAAAPFGWTRYVESEADVVGLRGFGASAPGPALYEHFGLSAERIAAAAKARLA